VSYIGAQPPKGQYRKLRNFEASFDGILTSFQLEVDPGGAAYYVIPGSANQLIVSLGGVIQEPNVDYTVSSSQITFTTAPAGGLNCFIIQCGDALNIGVPSDGTVSASKLNPAGGLEGQTFVLDSNLQFAFAYASGATNRIINGNFDFWQRGTSFTLSTSFQYTADRWRAKVGTGGAGSIVRNTSATNNTYLTLAITTAGTGSHELGQPIEFVRSVTGDSGASTPVSVSFKLARTSGTGTVAVSLLQYFGSGGSPSGSVSLSLGTITPTGTSTSYTLSGTLASIAGKTFGTNNDDQLVLIFTPSNAVATYDFAAIQVEKGTVATPFEHRSYGQELALCQRYYYKTYNQAVVPGSASTAATYRTRSYSGSYASAVVQFPVLMRTAPTCTVYNPSSGATNSWRDIDSSADRSAGLSTVLDSAVTTESSSVAANTSNFFHIVATAEL
jgi:hypothetical protein